MVKTPFFSYLTSQFCHLVIYNWQLQLLTNPPFLFLLIWISTKIIWFYILFLSINFAYFLNNYYSICSYILFMLFVFREYTYIYCINMLNWPIKFYSILTNTPLSFFPLSVTDYNFIVIFPSYIVKSNFTWHLSILIFKKLLMYTFPLPSEVVLKIILFSSNPVYSSLTLTGYSI